MYDAADDSKRSYDVAIDAARAKYLGAERIVRIGEHELIQGDCLKVMEKLGRVDAVVTDPPYGIGFAAQPTNCQRRAGKTPKDWDDSTRDEIVERLPMVAPSIIWGGNYYNLPPSRGWLSWFKPDAPPSMAHFELAWTSFNANARQLSVSIAATNAERVGHPTQKPVAVMRWCLGFLPDAQTILDPFMGSGTTGVACEQLGRRFTGIEIDPDYFDIAVKRVREAYAQPKLFDEPKPRKAENLNFFEDGAA